MQTYKTNSPCLSCQRVRDPKNCENKLCKEWQAWFIDRWEDMRARVMLEAHGKGIEGDMISVGGTRYHHPEHIRQFLKTDPCLHCSWSGDLCPGTCETRKVWLEAKERVNELESGSKRQTEKI